MPEPYLENDEEFDLHNFLVDCVHEKKLLSVKDAFAYNHLLSLKRREKKYTLSDLARWHEEDEKTVLGRLDRLADCNLIEPYKEQESN